MDDFRGELREFRDEDCGEPRAVGALVGDEAAGAGDPVEVRRQRVFRWLKNPRPTPSRPGRQIKSTLLNIHKWSPVDVVVVVAGAALLEPSIRDVATDVVPMISSDTRLGCKLDKLPLLRRS